MRNTGNAPCIHIIQTSYLHKSVCLLDSWLNSFKLKSFSQTSPYNKMQNQHCWFGFKETHLSYDVASDSVIKPYIKNDNQLVD